jgi:hypothetical protein
VIQLGSGNFTRITFGAGPLSAEKLNGLVDNTNFLYDKMVRGGYYVNGFNKETSVRIQGMLVSINNNINNVSRFSNVYWPKPFTAGCIPVITYSHYFTEAIIHNVGIRGIGGGIFPDNVGFRMEVFAPKTEYGDEWRGTHWYPVIGLGY